MIVGIAIENSGKVAESWWHVRRFVTRCHTDDSQMHVSRVLTRIAAVGSKARATRTVQVGDRVGTVVEITGTEGTLLVPDPNMFTGEVKITRAPALAAIGQEPEWESVPLTGALAGRGTGVLGMARSIRTGSRPLASGALGYHVLDTLMAMDESVASGRTVDITSTVDAVPLVDEDWDPFAATV
jgi:predicted dehydrogenase